MRAWAWSVSGSRDSGFRRTTSSGSGGSGIGSGIGRGGSDGGSGRGGGRALRVVVTSRHRRGTTFSQSQRLRSGPASHYCMCGGLLRPAQANSSNGGGEESRYYWLAGSPAAGIRQTGFEIDDSCALPQAGRPWHGAGRQAGWLAGWLAVSCVDGMLYQNAYQNVWLLGVVLGWLLLARVIGSGKMRR